MTTMKTRTRTGSAALLLLFAFAASGCNRADAPPGENGSNPAFQSANAPDGTRTEGAPSDGEPTRTAQSGPFRFNMDLDPSPARAGVKTTLNLMALEENSPLTGATATAVLKSAGAATLTVPLKQTNPGTFSGTATFPAPGAWTADVTAKRQMNTGTATFTLAVGPAASP